MPIEQRGQILRTWSGLWPWGRSCQLLCRAAACSGSRAYSALLEDLHERGLLANTVVTALGEFGRTPKISTLSGQSKAGRDHWANAMSVLFAGGGTPGGQVVGATDRKGFAAVERVLSPENFVSTVYTKLGIDPDKIVYAQNGRPAHLVSDATPIHELI